MDIAKRLDTILAKYHIIKEIDTHKFEMEVKKIAERQEQGGTIALYGAGKESRSLIQNILVHYPRFRIDKCFDQMVENYQYKTVVKDTVVEKVCKKSIDKFNMVLIGSRTYSAVFKSKLLELEYSGEVIDLYDAFGGFIDDHFSDHQYVYEARKRYEEATEEFKQPTLSNLIKQFILIKDFINFFHYVDIYIENRYKDYTSYSLLKREIEQLLEDIKSYMVKRNPKDIVINWVDALSFYDMSQFDFLSNESKKGTFFEKAYTTIPWTTDVMKSILFAEYPIEGKLFLKNHYNKDNTKLLAMLSCHGYKFCYCGIDRMAMLYEGEDVMVPIDVYNHKYDSSTTKQWDALRFLCESDQPLCIIVHNLNETHMPYVCGLVDTFIDFGVMPKDWNDTRCQMQAEISGRYLDEQLAFYSDLYGENTIRIYMSDHGRKGNSSMDENKIHVMLFVLGKGVKQKRIKSLFSLIDMCMLVENIICDRDLDDVRYDREYVRVENLDTYSKQLVDMVISGEKNWEDMRQCRGVVTKEDKFFVHYIGSSYYFVDGNKDNQINNEKYRERIEYLRHLCGNEFIDISKYDKFKYACKLYDEAEWQK